MNEWILVVIAILTPVLSGAVSWGVNKQRWKSMDETILNFRKDHVEHFEHAKEATATMATLAQQMKDHAERDDDRFGRIEEMFREMRGDVKELLGRR